METVGPALDTSSMEALRKMTSTVGCVGLEAGKRSTVSLLFFSTHHKPASGLFFRTDQQ